MRLSRCFREFVGYTSLNVLGMVGISCYILADTFFVSLGLGSNGLTALNLAIPVYSFINGSGLMIGMGGGTRFSIQKSRDDHAAANRAFTHAVMLAAAASLIFMAAGIFFIDNLVSMLGADETVYDMSRTYMLVLLLFSPAFIANNLLLCFIRNDGAPRLAMIAMITGSLSNVVLDWVFIFPLRMGIFGAVLATGLAPIISIGVLSRHFIAGKNSFSPVKCAPEAATVGRIISGGVPSLLTEVSSGVVIIIFNSIILSLEGNVGVAAYGVVTNLSLVVIAVYTGMAQGIQPLLSRNHGMKNTADIKAVLRYAMVAMLIFSVAVYSVIFLAAHQVAGIFNSENNAALQSIAENGLKLYFIACPFAGFNIIVSMYFTSTERPFPAHVISMLRGFIVIIPTVLLFAYLWSLNGVWLSFPATEVVVAIVGIMLYNLAANVPRL